MVIVIDGKLQLSNEFVSCNGETKPVGEEGKNWWVETCALHGYDYEFLPATYPPDVLKRFEEVKNLDPKHFFAVELYVRDGVVPPDISLALENARLNEELTEQQGVIDDLIMLLADKGVIY